MKNSYKKIMAALANIVCAFAMVSCYSSLSYNDAIQKNISRADDPDKHDDARFIADAASYNLLATQMAEEAIKSGYSASLVSLAKENLEAHHDMKRELRRVARRENFLLPREMSDEHQKLLNQLKNADRRDFDRTYIRTLLDISDEDGEIFSRMATEAKSKDIRAFAAEQLGVFETHKTQLQSVDADLLRTY